MKRPSLAIFTPEYVNLPGLLALRTQRYAIYLSILAIVLVVFNSSAITQESVLWFLALVAALFAIVCAICVTLLDAIAWNFERLREELHGAAETVNIP